MYKVLGVVTQIIVDNKRINNIKTKNHEMKPQGKFHDAVKKH